MLARYKEEERKKLCVQIEEWNASRLDMFTLSQPDENLEFFGVMRFFFQEEASKVSTKCVRVASTASCFDVIGALIEKFRPDMKMLVDRDYALYEVHDGEERKMIAGERPLLVQLNWTADDREGRFMLRELSNNTLSNRLSSSTGDLREEGMERKMSRRQRRQLKKQRRQEQKLQEQQKVQEPQEVSSFMRSLSNPELVLNRRRKAKMEKKLNDINSLQNGGTLKIFGHSLKPDVPYKTLLLSIEDKVREVVVEALEKYGLENEDSDKFCLVQVLMVEGGDEGSGVVEERVMDDEECPLAILLKHPESLGIMKFHLRVRPANAPKTKLTPQLNTNSNYINNSNIRESQINNGPFLMPIRADGSDRSDGLRCFIAVGRTSIGSDSSSTTGKEFYQLISPDVFPEHCDIVRGGDGRVWIEERMGKVVVDGQFCSYPTLLNHGSIIQIGTSHIFRFIDPSVIKNANKIINNNNKNNLHLHITSYNNNSMTLNNNLPLNKVLQHSPSNSSICTKDLETTFDLEGHVITAPTNPLNHLLPPTNQSSSNQSHLLNQSSFTNQALHGNSNTNTIDKLPAMFFVNEQGEDVWLDECTHRLNFVSLHLKVEPSFIFYLATRSRLNQPLATQQLSLKISSRVAALVQENPSNPPLLSFWLANSSELLNFYHSDHTLSKATQPSSAKLLQVVQTTFGLFLECLQVEMELTLPSFVNAHHDTNHFEEDFLGKRLTPTLANLLHVLTLAMSVLRRCRVNAGITIQIFSQLFKFANAWLFNCILLDSHIGLCSREWGSVIRQRIEDVVMWAEKQGLELAAQCHFAKCIQLCQLLEFPKSNISIIPSNFQLLNPVQIYTALKNFQPALPPSISHLPTPDGELEESLEACPTLILPEDGFCCDSIQGLPQSILTFAGAFEEAGLGRLMVNPNASGAWNVYMIDNEGYDKPSAVLIRLRKINKSLGVSIVSAKSSEDVERGIYVKSVVNGGAAHLDGRLEPGDQLLSVGDQSLLGVSQEKAAEIMTRTGEVVDLMVLKQGALFNNLPSLMPQLKPPSAQSSIHPPLQQNIYQKLPNQPNHYQTSVQTYQHLPNQHNFTTQQSSHSIMTQQVDLNQRNVQHLQPQQHQSPQLISQQQPPNFLQSGNNVIFQDKQQVKTFQQNTPISQLPQPKLQMSTQAPYQQPVPHDSTHLRYETANTFPHQSSQLQRLSNESIQNPSIYFPTQTLNQPPTQASSSLLSNLKLTRPLSSLSSKKPGYASQVLFPKNQPINNNNKNVNQMNTKNKANSNDINNNLKTNLDFDNKTNHIDHYIMSQPKDSEYKHPSGTFLQASPPLPPLTNDSPSSQASHNPQTYDFPSPPLGLQTTNRKPDHENYSSISANPSSIQKNASANLLPPHSVIHVPINAANNVPIKKINKLPPVAAKPKLSKSPWDREVIEKEEEEERKGRQIQEIIYLRAKENRSYEEEQRLKRLQTEEEFDRRAMQEQLSSKSITQLEPISTPGAMKKNVTFNENVIKNEYHRSFSSNSSEAPISPSRNSFIPNQHSTHQSIPLDIVKFTAYQAPVNTSNHSDSTFFHLPNNQSSQPFNKTPIQQPNHTYQHIHPSVQTSVSNFNIAQPSTYTSISSTHSQHTGNQYSSTEYHPFHVPPTVIHESDNESLRKDFVRLAKIENGPSYEAPVNYHIKPKLTPPHQNYQQPQQYITRSSYNHQQPTNNNQPQTTNYQQQSSYQQQQQQQNFYISQQQTPSQPSYHQQALEQNPQTSFNNPSTYLHQPTPNPKQPTYSSQTNQNFVDYNYQ